MTTETQFQTIAPIGDTDPLHLPVADLDKAIAYYTSQMGFTLHARPTSSPKTALLVRDNVTLGLAENGEDPEQASCYLGVGDVLALHQEYSENSIQPSALGEMEYDGQRYQVFWVKDPDGICYCIGRQIE